MSEWNIESSESSLYTPSFVSDWQRTSLVSMAKWTNGIAFRSIQFSSLGRPVIKIAELKNGITAQTKYTRQAFHDSVFVQRGDMLFSWSGQPETSIDVFRWNGIDGWLNQHIFRVETNDEHNDGWFYYLLRYLKPVFIRIARNKQTTGLGHITKTDLSNITIAYPPLHEQKAIAHILGSLDDKIEQLRRTNSVLEEMTSALFKSWFVDFDPVKAKQENIPTGLPPELDSLFPDSFEDSSLGPIPKGWQAGCVGDVCKLSKDSVNPGKHPDEVFAHYSLPAFDEGQEPKLETGSIIKSNKYLVPSDAVLLSKLNPHIPRIWMPDVANNNRPIASTEYLVLSPKAGYSRGYVFGLVTSSAFTSIYGTMVSGTTGSHQRVTPSHVLEVSLVLPSDEVLNEYADLVMDLYSKKHSNTRQIRNLTNLRDTLLPNLISGELRVPEVEEMVSELGL
jgi:type I restriction enzyme S subunit